jgi:transcriptional regulator with XRE-family HTH domain
MPTSSKPAIGARLRAHRERRGITLAALAESIKVKQTLLESLERSDLSRWPPGIYGRALVREYAKSIGLPPNETLEQLGELFPEDERRERGSRPPQAVPVPGSHPQLRLIPAGPSTPATSVRYFRVRAAVIEAIVIIALACVLSAIGVLGFSTAAALLALTWYPLAATVCGHEALHRKLRPRRFVMPFRNRELAPAAHIIDMGIVPVVPPLDSTAEPSLIIDRDVHASTTASVH